LSYAFISYKREDELRVGRLARALEVAGVEVWWDRGLPGGESWHTNIESRLGNAGCVIVVWSVNSAGPDGGFVREEARRGLNRNVLVPVLLDPIAHLPLGFGEIQALDLTGWRGSQNDPFLQDLVATVRAKIAGAEPPPPKGPRQRIARRLMWGGASGAGLVFLALFTFNIFGMASGLCTLPGAQPGLSDTCGDYGLGNRPSRVERLAWDARTPGSCPALRDHIARFPDGALRRKAADLLTARKSITVETWKTANRSLALFEPSAEPVARDEAAAKADAALRGKDTAEKLCRGFGAGTLFRFVSASAVAEKWTCTKSRSGVACGFEGHAECELSERQTAEREECQ
jgi:hypothetical protein